MQWVFAFALGGQFKHFVDELILTPNISAAHPSNLSLAQHVDCFVTLNRSSRSPKFSESLLGIHSSFDGPMVLLNGLITNDKFCLIRVSRQKLRYARRPRALPCQITDVCEYPRDERHRGGANEATVESPSAVPTDQGCGAAMGSSLSTSVGMDPTEQTGCLSAFLSSSSRSGGER